MLICRRVGCDLRSDAGKNRRRKKAQFGSGLAENFVRNAVVGHGRRGKSIPCGVGCLPAGGLSVNPVRSGVSIRAGWSAYPQAGGMLICRRVVCDFQSDAGKNRRRKKARFGAGSAKNFVRNAVVGHGRRGKSIPGGVGCLPAGRVRGLPAGGLGAYLPAGGFFVCGVRKEKLCGG